MIRVTNNLRYVASVVLCATVVGCGGGGDDDGAGGDDISKYPNVLKVVFSPMYSAFDGTHDYKIPATIDAAALDQNGTDPVVPGSVTWNVDSKFVSKAPYEGLPGGVMLTTKNSGVTQITAVAKTKSNMMVKGTAMLTISKASPDEWAMGEARYNNNVPIDFTKLGMMAGGGMPGLGSLRDLIPANSSCGNCHNNNGMGLTVEHTPQQTGGYSDEELIAIFTTGKKPLDYTCAGTCQPKPGISTTGGANGRMCAEDMDCATYASPLFKMAPARLVNMIYTILHTWDIAPEVEKGIVFKLRSIAPASQPEIDLSRLRMMAMGAATGTPPAAGAAGSGM